jgi:cytochrome c peroxidase
VKPACKNPFTDEASALMQRCWPVPEVGENVNTDELGNLKLSDQEVDDIVAFMHTLTDGWKPHSRGH